MFKPIHIIGITVFFILSLFSLGFSEETFTITTYYPSPYGSYNELKVDETSYFDEETDNGNSGTADTIDWGAGNMQKSTLTGNCTYTFTAPPGPCLLILRVIQDATGSRTVTWPATAKWPGGVAPVLTTTASAVDVFTFVYNGTNYNNIGFAPNVK